MHTELTETNFSFYRRLDEVSPPLRLRRRRLEPVQPYGEFGSGLLSVSNSVQILQLK